MNPWESRFAQQNYVYGTEPNQFIKEHIQFLNQGKQLAAYAEGEGRNAVFLAKNGFNVTAYDYAKTGIEKTLRLADVHQVQLSTKLVDLIEQPLLEDTYDGAILIFGHFPKTEQFRVLDKIMASLKTDGVLMMEVYEEKQLDYKTGGPPDVDWLYNAEDLLKWAKSFHLKHFYVGEAERNEGELHSGLGYVVQLIVEKR
ncbi:class I SAM-dependent methyltransferase [Solibacillus sp. FSL K6-1523]|uniref:class I SAM-dependent methyltransferase n=1 Tax=Solibacillus sp. FSL K6-1523 TaxID=2921471 RepID=UPI0030F58E83